MIRKVEVKGLNNRLNGAWEFKEDLNVITGRNGSGKTTLLKLIWYLISGNIGQVISDIPFQSVSIETDSFLLSVTQFTSNEGELVYQFANEAVKTEIFEIPLQSKNIEWIRQLDERIARTMHSSLFFPSFRRIEGGFARIFRDIPTDDFVRRIWSGIENRTTELLHEMMSQLSTEISVTNHNFVASISTRDIGELLTEKYADVLKTDEPIAELAGEFTRISEEIAQKISEKKSLSDMVPILEDLHKQLEQIAEERKALLGPLSALGKWIRDIFQYEGIRVTKGITLGEENKAIESDKLSAGEKQMLSFLCYNAFSENTAIFIDEPELSLHIDWQRLLLPTLLEQDTGNQFFVATHSPFIYTQYPEREILLDEDRGGA